jgi:hypothetical protein
VIRVAALVCATAVTIVIIVMKQHPAEEHEAPPAQDDEPSFIIDYEPPSTVNQRGGIRRGPA